MFEIEDMTIYSGYNHELCPPDLDCSPLDFNPDASCGPDYSWE